MKIGVIIETNNPEKAWNGIRFANTALKQKHEVQLFLMGAGVEAESITDEKYNVRDQLHAFIAHMFKVGRQAAHRGLGIKRIFSSAFIPPIGKRTLRINVYNSYRSSAG